MWGRGSGSVPGSGWVWPSSSLKASGFQASCEENASEAGGVVGFYTCDGFCTCECIVHVYAVYKIFFIRIHIHVISYTNRLLNSYMCVCIYICIHIEVHYSLPKD